MSVRRKPQRKKISRKKQAQIARKIRILMREGYPQRQAIAIAYRMAGVPRKRKHRASKAWRRKADRAYKRKPRKHARRKQSHASLLRKRRHYYAYTMKPRRARLRRHIAKIRKWRRAQGYTV